MLVNLKEICAVAEERKMAVGSFNACSLASLKAVFRAAEEMQAPFVIQFAQCHEVYNSLEDLGPLMIRYAKRASVPVCVHLDHGEDLAYLEKALQIGFTGVMFDGSALPYGENAELSRKAAQLAHQYGAGCEAELGCMGRRETGEDPEDKAEMSSNTTRDPSSRPLQPKKSTRE